MKRRWILIAGIIIVILCVAGIFTWKQLHKKEKATDISQTATEKDLDWFGVGTGSEQDMCFIKDDHLNIEYQVVPGKYIIYNNSTGTRERIREPKDSSTYRDKFQFEQYDTILYDIVQEKEEQRFDIKGLTEEYAPGFQVFSGPNAYMGKDGHIYICQNLVNIPEKATDEEIGKRLFVDIETGEVSVEDGGQGEVSFIENLEEKQKEYWDKFEQADWDTFCRENNLLGKNSKVSEADDLAKDREFLEYLSETTEGCIELRVSTEALPQDNEILYSRFPGLEQWKGVKGKEARIYIGGYPAAEEVQAMFQSQ